MKKFAYLAAIALISVPAVAHADNYGDSKKGKIYHETRAENRVMTHDADVTANVITENDFYGDIGQRNFRLENGGMLTLEDTVVYKNMEDGSRFFAPSSTYKTTEGYNIVVEDGILNRIEAPQLVAVDFGRNDRTVVETRTIRR